MLGRWRCSLIFSKIFGISLSRFLADEIAQKFIYKICIIRNNNGGVWVYRASKGCCYSVFPKFLVLVLSRILLHGIVQNFACNIFCLQDDDDIIFASIAYARIARKGRCCHNFSNIFGMMQILCFIEFVQKFICKIHSIRNNNYAF